MYGAPFAPIQRLTNAVSTAVDISSFHRFGDLAYVVDYVKNRAGKLSPVSFRGFYG